MCAGVSGDILKLTVDGDLLFQDNGTLNPDGSFTTTGGIVGHSDTKVTGSIVFNADSTLSAACGVAPFAPPGDAGD